MRFRLYESCLLLRVLYVSLHYPLHILPDIISFQIRACLVSINLFSLLCTGTPQLQQVLWDIFPDMEVLFFISMYTASSSLASLFGSTPAPFFLTGERIFPGQRT